MRERALELKEAARRRPGAGSSSDESAVLAKITSMAALDSTMSERLHRIIIAAHSPKHWHGMPAYAKDGNVICFFQGARKFRTRYATLGLSDKAKLDEGHMWPTAFALKDLTSLANSTPLAYTP